MGQAKRQKRRDGKGRLIVEWQALPGLPPSYATDCPHDCHAASRADKAVAW